MRATRGFGSCTAICVSSSEVIDAAPFYLPTAAAKAILFCTAAQENITHGHKIITGEVFELYYLNEWEKVVPIEKETCNGLEDPKDRGSVGWHGNQHVRLRGPQISARNSLAF
jgi:hypothetical protein